MLLSEQKKLDGGGGASFTTDDERRLERVRGELEEMLRADPIQLKRYEEDSSFEASDSRREGAFRDASVVPSTPAARIIISSRSSRASGETARTSPRATRG